MGYKKWLARLAGGGIAFCIAFGGWSGLVSAFDLEAELTAVGLCCGLLAIFYSLCLGSRFWLAGLCAFGVAAGFLWQKAGMLSQLEALLYHITGYYNRAYGWGRILWSSQVPTVDDLTPLVCMLSAVCLLALMWVIGRRKRAVWAVLPAILPGCLCVVVTDTVPEETYLYLLLLGIGLLALTQSVRRRNEVRGGVLTALLAPPAALLLGLLFLLTPQEDYVGLDYGQAVLENALGWLQETAQQTKFPQRLAGAVGMTVTDTMELDTVGPKTDLRIPVMEVKAAESGTLYLRGRSYDIYDGTSWSASEGTWVNDGQFSMTAGGVTVTTWAVHPVLYIPYGGGSGNSLQGISGGYFANTEELLSYTLPADHRDGYAPGDGADADMSQYLALPEDTREQAREILAQYLNTEEAKAVSSRYLAEKIRDFVRNSAEYDLDTRRMPGSAEDFAIWFLEESDTGYCVHFATASAVLLRAAGIPARYVTGYMVTAQAGKTVTVGTDQGHAWVEYWIPGEGWQLLEATPAASGTAQESTQASRDQPLPTETAETSQSETGGVSAAIGGQGGTDVGAERPKANGLWNAAKWILLAVLLMGVIVGQWALRLWLRRRKRRRLAPNPRAIALWQEAERLSRLMKEPPEQNLYHLAQKAKYSRHTLTPDELARFDAYLEMARARLKEKPLHLRLVYRLVFAAY